MNRFLKWLGKKLYRKELVRGTTLQQTISRSNAAAKATPNGTQVAPGKPVRGSADYGGDANARIEDGGPGKNVYVRNKYIREDSGTHEKLKIVDESLLQEDDEDGLDPYNTGRFDRSKTWKLRS